MKVYRCTLCPFECAEGENHPKDGLFWRHIETGHLLTCEEFIELLNDYVEGMLDGITDRRMQFHIAAERDDKACKRKLDAAIDRYHERRRQRLPAMRAG